MSDSSDLAIAFREIVATQTVLVERFYEGDQGQSIAESGSGVVLRSQLPCLPCGWARRARREWGANLVYARWDPADLGSRFKLLGGWYSAGVVNVRPNESPL